jgi:hypothetical protein
MVKHIVAVRYPTNKGIIQLIMNYVLKPLNVIICHITGSTESIAEYVII